MDSKTPQREPVRDARPPRYPTHAAARTDRRRFLARLGAAALGAGAWAVTGCCAEEPLPSGGIASDLGWDPPDAGGHAGADSHADAAAEGRGDADADADTDTILPLQPPTDGGGG